MNCMDAFILAVLPYGQESLHFFTLRISEYLFGCSFLLYHAVGDKDDSVGDHAGKLHFVSYYYHRAVGALERADDSQNLAGQLGVESRQNYDNRHSRDGVRP